MRNKTWAVLFLISIMIGYAAVAHAEWYARASGGHADSNWGRESAGLPTYLPGTEDTDSKVTTNDIALGFTAPNGFGAEVAYMKFSTVSAMGQTQVFPLQFQTFSSRAQGFVYAATYTYPVNDDFKVGVRVGMFDWGSRTAWERFTAPNTRVGLDVSVPTTGQSLFTGAFARYNATDNLFLRADLWTTNAVNANFYGMNFGVGISF